MPARCWVIEGKVICQEELDEEAFRIDPGQLDAHLDCLPCRRRTIVSSFAHYLLPRNRPASRLSSFAWAGRPLNGLLISVQCTGYWSPEEPRAVHSGDWTPDGLARFFLRRGSCLLPHHAWSPCTPIPTHSPFDRIILLETCSPPFS